jgi:hypothetical protein
MARRQVSIFLDGKQVENSLTNIRKKKREINAELRDMVVGSDKYNEKVKELQGLNGLLKDHRNNLKTTSSTYDKLKTGATRFLGAAAAAFAADSIVRYGSELFKLGAEMEVLTAKAETVFGMALPLVNKAAEDNANAMGLTISQYTDAAAAIGDLLVPMGFTRDEAANVSVELTNLSGALSEWTGGQVTATQVSDILGKAILGERESLKQLGISIKEADVSARLAAKGLDNLTGASLEQAKAAATLELITEKSVDAQNAFAEGADTNIRKMAELQARFESVRERMATALVPVFSKLLDGALRLGDAIGDLGVSMGSATDKFNKQEESVRALEGELLPLLDRYDDLSTKSKLSEQEQDELRKVIQRIGEITPTAITEIDEYGRVLSVNTKASKEFLEAEKARLAFVNKEAIFSLESQIDRLKEQREIQKEVAETGRGGLLNVQYSPGVINQAREDVGKLTKEIQGAQAQLNRLTGNDIAEPAAPVTPTDGGGGADDDTIQDEETRKKQEEARKKHYQKVKEQYDKLVKITRDFAERQRLARLDEQEKAEAEILARYQEQIDKARKLDAQGIQQAAETRKQLETLQQQELEMLRDEFLVQELEAQNERFEIEFEQLDQQFQQELEKELEALIAKDEAKKEVEAFIKEGQLTAEQEELARLEEYFQEIKSLAEEHGLDMAAVTETYNQRIAEIEAKYEDKKTEDLVKAQQKRADAVAQGLGAIANITSSIGQLATEAGIEQTAIGKGLALTTILAKGGEAIAKAVASAAGQPFPANLVAIGTSIAAVTGAISSARKLFNEAPEVPQAYTGGYYDVLGARDRRKYRAKYIGEQDTGLLPPGPALLTNERGREFLVSHQDLQKPAVLKRVQEIEAIGKGKPVEQKFDGGFTSQEDTLTSQRTPADQNNAGGSSPALDQAATLTPELLRAVLSELRMINKKMDSVGGVDDDRLVAYSKRLQKLDRLSGGAL